WMNRLEKEHDGLRAAFSWFLDHGRGADALELAADLWLFQESRGHAEEARTWLAKALAAPGAEPRSINRARALYGAGILAFRNLDDDTARQAFEECRALRRSRNTSVSSSARRRVSLASPFVGGTRAKSDGGVRRPWRSRENGARWKTPLAHCTC